MTISIKSLERLSVLLYFFYPDSLSVDSLILFLSLSPVFLPPYLFPIDGPISWLIGNTETTRRNFIPFSASPTTFITPLLSSPSLCSTFFMIQGMCYSFSGQKPSSPLLYYILPLFINQRNHALSLIFNYSFLLKNSH